MNKKIRNFERESGIDVYGLGTDRAKWELKLEKFHELVVLDVINQVKLWENDSRNHISYLLKNHYGVDE